MSSRKREEYVPFPREPSKRAVKPWLAEMKKTLGKIIEREDAEIFRVPVDWKSLGLFDYPVIIKEPRDLGTISKGLEQGLYSSIDAVAADVRLIWYNCMLYNPAESNYYNLALGHAGLWESQYRYLRQSLGLAPELTAPVYPIKGRLPTDHLLSILLPSVAAPPPAHLSHPPSQGGQVNEKIAGPCASAAGICLLDLAAVEVSADFLLEHARSALRPQ
jgi:hypothetical protein